MNKNIILIDVRSPEEFASGHAKGAINFDVQRLGQGEMPDLAKSAKLKLYCRSGGRAELAKNILKQHGFSDVENLGGIDRIKDQP